jgi:hypothetical protein
VGKIVMSDGKAANCKEMIVTHMAMLCIEGSALVTADTPKDAGAYDSRSRGYKEDWALILQQHRCENLKSRVLCEGVCLDQG